MSTGHHLGALPALLPAVLLAVLPGVLPGAALSPALAAGLVTGGTADDGYVASAFEKLGRHWSPPPGLHGDFKVQVEVLIDGRGGIAGCTTRQSSGMDAFDAAACGAVEQAGSLGVPPGGKPMTLYCTFQSQRERERLPDPDEELQKEVRARMEAQNRFSTQRAGWAEEDARYKAEKAARAQGQTFEGYDFVPGQDLPGAREILERPVRVQPGPRHPAEGAGRSAASEAAAAAAPAAGGAPSLPEDEADLAVAPGRQPSPAAPEGAGTQTPQAPGAEAAPVRMVTLGDIAAGIAVRRKAPKGAPAHAPATPAAPAGPAGSAAPVASAGSVASAAPAVQPGPVAGGKAPGKSAGMPGGKAARRPAAQAKTPAPGKPDATGTLPAGTQPADAMPADTMPVVRQSAPDDAASPERKDAEAPSALPSARQPRAVPSQPGKPGKAGKAPLPTPGSQPSRAAPAGSASKEDASKGDASKEKAPKGDASKEKAPKGDASKTPSAQASPRPVPAGAAPASSGGMQEGTKPVPAAPPAPAAPSKPAATPRPSAGVSVPSPPSGEVRGPVVYPPEYGNAGK